MGEAGRKLAARMSPGWRLESCVLHRCGPIWTVRLTGRRSAGRSAAAAAVSAQARVRIGRAPRPGDERFRRRLLAALAQAFGELAMSTGAGLAIGRWRTERGGLRKKPACPAGPARRRDGCPTW